MRHEILQYTTDQALEAWLASCDIGEDDSILVQLFSGILDPDILHPLIERLLRHMPHAHIIGTTTAGEILEGTMRDETIVISLSLFEHTALKSFHATGEDSYLLGKKAAEHLVEDGTRCVILFADGLKCNGDALIRGFDENSAYPVVIAGGLAGDNLHMERTFCLHGDEIFEGGVVGISFTNPDLKVTHTYNLSWTPIGKEMTVTRAVGNIVYEIDRQPVMDVFRHYLGDKVLENIPVSSTEFPLLFVQNGITVARSTVGATPEGGMIFAGEIEQGTTVRFGIASPTMLRQSTKASFERNAERPIEGLYCYSCTARKVFLGKTLENEFSPLAQIAPMAGFFTYGEFYHGETRNRLLNITTTLLGLSESDRVVPRKTLKHYAPEKTNMTAETMIHLVNTITREKTDQVAQSIIDSTIEALFVLDSDKRIVRANQEACHMFGYTMEQLIGRRALEFVAEESLKDVKHNIRVADQLPYEATLLRSDGTKFPAILRGRDIVIDGEKMRISATIDITELKAKEAEALHLAYHDSMTGLPNRQKLVLDLREKRHHACIIFNVDHFGQINDLFGTKSGDTVLSKIADALGRLDLPAYRIAGDEFSILIESPISASRLESLVRDIQSRIERIEFFDQEEPYSLSIRTGAAIGTEKLLSHAHIAIREAKRKRLPYVLYDQSEQVEERYKANITMTREIRKALENGRIVCHYQPIAETATTKVNKYEALVRMVGQDGQIVPPGEFLTIAKTTRFYPRITDTVVTQACTTFAKRPEEFSINLSIRDLEDPTTIQHIISTILDTGTAERVIFELLESEEIENYESVSRFIRQVKALGAKIAIDDFGSGYSNFEHILRLNVDYLKIDGSLVSELPRSDRHRIIVETIVEFARKTGAETIAEFVCDDNVYAAVKELGIDYAQGYAIGKPQPLDG